MDLGQNLSCPARQVEQHATTTTVVARLHRKMFHLQVYANNRPYEIFKNIVGCKAQVGKSRFNISVE